MLSIQKAGAAKLSCKLESVLIESSVLRHFGGDVLLVVTRELRSMVQQICDQSCVRCQNGDSFEDDAINSGIVSAEISFCATTN